MTSMDWTLLVIAAAGGKPVSPVQLQKALFLIGRNLTPDQRRCAEFYDFRPYDFGPFDPAIYEDVEKLQAEDLVVISPPTYRTYREYTATPAGTKAAADLRTELGQVARDYLDEVVRWVRSLSFDQLVRAIYREYPETKVNSVFR